MRDHDEEERPEPAGDSGAVWLLLAGLAAVLAVALALLVAPVVADDPAALNPARFLATWAAR